MAPTNVRLRLVGFWLICAISVFEGALDGRCSGLVCDFLTVKDAEGTGSIGKTDLIMLTMWWASQVGSPGFEYSIPPYHGNTTNNINRRAYVDGCRRISMNFLLISGSWRFLGTHWSLNKHHHLKTPPDLLESVHGTCLRISPTGVDPAVPPEELLEAHERMRQNPEEERIYNYCGRQALVPPQDGYAAWLHPRFHKNILYILRIGHETGPDRWCSL